MQCTLLKCNFVVEREMNGRTFYLIMYAELSPSGPLQPKVPGCHFLGIPSLEYFLLGGVGNLFVIYLICSQLVACIMQVLDYSVSLMRIEVSVEDYL